MDQVEQVKRKVDVVEVVGDYVALKKAGRNFKGLCPFHSEKTASFMVNPELQIYKCFGCGKGGDVISFIEEMEGVEFREALEMLADRAGVKLKPMGERKDRSEQKRMIEAHELAKEYYHYLLTEHKRGKEALKYLNDRGVGEKLIEEFKLGYALESWEGLYKYLVNKKNFEPELLVRAGLLIKSSKGKGYYDRFRGRVMFPLIDHRGRNLAFGGRILPGLGDEKTPKYINSPETDIYHKSEMLYGFYQAKQAIRKNDRVVVVEGEMDMISSYGAGVTETVAIKGTALTIQQVRLIKRLTKRMVLALDADEAGQDASKRSIEVAEKQGVNVRVVAIEGSKDPDDVVRKSKGKWKKMVENAQEVYDYLIEKAKERHNLESGEGKNGFTEEILPVLARIRNQVVMAHYLKKVADTLDVSEDWVVREVERKIKAGEVGEKEREMEKEESKEKESRKEQLLREIWAYLLRVDREVGSEAIGRLRKIKVGSKLRKLLNNWEEYFIKKDKGRVAEWIKQLPDELKKVPQEAYMKEVEEERVKWNLQLAIDEYEELLLRNRLRELENKIGKAEKDEDEKALEENRTEFVRLSKRLSEI